MKKKFGKVKNTIKIVAVNLDVIDEEGILYFNVHTYIFRQRLYQFTVSHGFDAQLMDNLPFNFIGGIYLSNSRTKSLSC